MKNIKYFITFVSTILLLSFTELSFSSPLTIPLKIVNDRNRLAGEVVYAWAPLASGNYSCVVTYNDNPIPAQIVDKGLWGNGTRRNIGAYFQLPNDITISQFSNTGLAFKCDAGLTSPIPATSINVQNLTNEVVVSTGPATFTMDKNNPQTVLKQATINGVNYIVPGSGTGLNLLGWNNNPFTLVAGTTQIDFPRSGPLKTVMRIVFNMNTNYPLATSTSPAPSNYPIKVELIYTFDAGSKNFELAVNLMNNNQYGVNLPTITCPTGSCPMQNIYIKSAGIELKPNLNTTGMQGNFGTETFNVGSQDNALSIRLPGLGFNYQNVLINYYHGEPDGDYSNDFTKQRFVGSTQVSDVTERYNDIHGIKESGTNRTISLGLKYGDAQVPIDAVIGSSTQAKVRLDFLAGNNYSGRFTYPPRFMSIGGWDPSNTLTSLNASFDPFSYNLSGTPQNSNGAHVLLGQEGLGRHIRVLFDNYTTAKNDFDRWQNPPLIVPSDPFYFTSTQGAFGLPLTTYTSAAAHFPTNMQIALTRYRDSVLSISNPGYNAPNGYHSDPSATPISLKHYIWKRAGIYQNTAETFGRNFGNIPSADFGNHTMGTPLLPVLFIDYDPITAYGIFKVVQPMLDHENIEGNYWGPNDKVAPLGEKGLNLSIVNSQGSHHNKTGQYANCMILDDPLACRSLEKIADTFTAQPSTSAGYTNMLMNSGDDREKNRKAGTITYAQILFPKSSYLNKLNTMIHNIKNAADWSQSTKGCPPGILHNLLFNAPYQNVTGATSLPYPNNTCGYRVHTAATDAELVLAYKILKDNNISDTAIETFLNNATNSIISNVSTRSDGRHKLCYTGGSQLGICINNTAYNEQVTNIADGAVMALLPAYEADFMGSPIFYQLVADMFKSLNIGMFTPTSLNVDLNTLANSHSIGPNTISSYAGVVEKFWIEYINKMGLVAGVLDKWYLAGAPGAGSVPVPPTPTPTPTPAPADTTPPVISNVIINPVANNQSVIFTWNTNEPAKAIIKLGNQVVYSSTTLTTNQNITVNNLIGVKTYTIQAVDAANNLSAPWVATAFNILATQDFTPSKFFGLYSGSQSTMTGPEPSIGFNTNNGYGLWVINYANAPSIPAGATVTGAKLKVKVKSKTGGTAPTINLNVAPFNQANTVGNSSTSMVNAVTGNGTYSHKVFPTIAWNPLANVLSPALVSTSISTTPNTSTWIGLSNYGGLINAINNHQSFGLWLSSSGNPTTQLTFNPGSFALILSGFVQAYSLSADNYVMTISSSYNGNTTQSTEGQTANILIGSSASLNISGPASAGTSVSCLLGSYATSNVVLGGVSYTSQVGPDAVPFINNQSLASGNFIQYAYIPSGVPYLSSSYALQCFTVNSGVTTDIGHFIINFVCPSGQTCN